MTPPARRRLRTSGLQASFLTFGTRSFPRSFVFINIAGGTFNFATEARSQEPEVRIMTPLARRRLRTSGLQASDNLSCVLRAGPGIRQVLRAALWGWPVPRRRSSKATLEPSVLSRKFVPIFLPPGKDFTIPDRKFLPVGNGLRGSAARPTKRHDGRGRRHKHG